MDEQKPYELPVEPMEVIPEPSEFTPMADDKLQAALAEIRGRSFSGRHPELGKMIKCQVHGFRHRQFEFGPMVCKQTFTHILDGYEIFREGENGELVPELRTVPKEGEKPTRRQITGRTPGPNRFVGPRHTPHFSKIKLQFIERVRVIFDGWAKQLENNLVRVEDEKRKEEIKTAYEGLFDKLLHRARVLAARQLRKERRWSSREIRRRQDQSRRINRGLL